MRNIAVGGFLVVGLLVTSGCGGGGPAELGAPGPEEEEVPGAYGLDPEEGPGAVVALGSEEESGGAFATMVEMLRGRVAGLQVLERGDGTIVLRIRGMAHSILAGEDPLLVVDGVPVPTYSMSSALRTMNPADVASIHVLKDTGSTSAYGMRGANGVILIRLKRQ